MSHQTGIQANDTLRNFFGKCRDGSIRLMKITIEKEQLTLGEFKEPQGSWEDDYDLMILPLLEEDQPCYILYRFDKEKDQESFSWIFISWSPDFSPVRQKMLYASTKATLKMEFGGSHISDELFGTTKEDICLQGYNKHKRAAVAPAPLTFAEEELQMIKSKESGVDISIDTKHQTMQGVAFPISDDVISKMFEIRDGQINYMQMSIDLEKEKINLENCADTDVTLLPHRIPKDHARYHLFNFKHTHEGDYLQSIVFIYSIPGFNCSVKERMLYSSCKGALLEVIENQVGLEISRKIEIDDGKELTEEFLMDEIHPKKNIHRQKFAKPKGPPNRGARRIIKTTPTDNSSNEGLIV